MKDKIKNLLKKENRKKSLIMVFSLLVLVIAIIIGLKFFVFSNGEIPFDDLIDKVETAEEITWTTFNRFDHIDREDGLVYRTYDVEGNYVLELSGKTFKKDPWAYTLRNTKTGQSIDIISEDIIEFLGDDY